MSNRVYTAKWNTTVAAVGSASAQFSIQSVGREIKIKSINLAWYMADQATNTPLPWRITTTQSIVLYAGNFVNRFAQAFDNLVAVLPASNGLEFIMTEPGQKFFDSFFVPNNLPLYWNINNFAAGPVDHFVSVTIETEEKTMFL